jgi:hyperosmotically inducible protein
MISILLRSALLAFMLSLAACASTPEQESTGEFFDSSLITAKIKNKLVDDPITGVFRIKVVTYKGVVQLSGFVNSAAEKQHAEIIANSVEGVVKVENSLLVTPVN